MTIELKSRIVLNKSASVVEMNAARLILFGLGYKLRRKDENILVFDAIENDDVPYSLYANQKDYPNENHIDSLYVDEGTFSYTMHIGGSLQTSQMYEELVDYRRLLRLTLRKFQPDTEHPCSASIGRGRAQSERIYGYHELLECEEQIEWKD